MTSQRQILVVEDNQINRALLCGILSEQYGVLEAENGQEALDVLKEHKDVISLILLDIVMPVMDGYTFLSVMKADPDYSSIPVIVTTQSDSETDEVTALAHGATDFVAKPYKPQVILHRVASIINLRETAAVVNQFQYDRLTGLYNKEFFYQRVRSVLLQNPGVEYDIVCSDIENFKLVNDVFGVPAGDALLRKMADTYTSLTGDRGLCGRITGDQFACFVERLPNYTDDIFLDATAQINSLPDVRNVVAKWGVYRVSDRTLSVEQMFDRALLAARSIRGQYGKYFAIYDDALRSALLREQSITDSMEDALAQGQFVVYLQPKYSLRDERMAGAEALVRWQHPRWGLLMPNDFVPLFEKNGFITKLDRYVWDKAAAILRGMYDKGFTDLPVSVNVSRADVYHADLSGTLLDIVRKYDIPPAALHLELTESAYTEDPDQIVETVTLLRELGFVVEMDDFGSGYSSLNMLNQMPLDILKLDMQFVRSETAKPAGQGILRFIMGLARWMDLRVVAEGVETREQLERLRDMGCDYGQGYYFAKPMPLEDFARLLEKSLTSHTIRPKATDSRRKDKLLLVADEDADYRAQVRSTFEGSYDVLEAEDVQTALSHIVSSEHRLSVVVLSLTLTGSDPMAETDAEDAPDAFAVLDHLQRKRALWPVPVIATGPVSVQLEERALELGADDFASKPHSQRSLWQRVLHTTGLTLSRERERLLQDAAYRDYLTGLLNRRGLSAATDGLGPEDLPIALFLFDLDNLKLVNDTMGHGQGDQMICKFGELLRLHTRGTDVLVRYGGDEFVVVMRQLPSEETALRKGREICRAFRESSDAYKFPAACSAGVVLSRSIDEPISNLIAQADHALYRAKQENKGDCCLWKGRDA